MPDDNLALVVDLKSEVLLLLFRSNSSKKSRTTRALRKRVGTPTKESVLNEKRKENMLE